MLCVLSAELDEKHRVPQSIDRLLTAGQKGIGSEPLLQSPGRRKHSKTAAQLQGLHGRRWEPGQTLLFSKSFVSGPVLAHPSRAPQPTILPRAKTFPVTDPTCSTINKAAGSILGGPKDRSYGKGGEIQEESMKQGKD